MELRLSGVVGLEITENVVNQAILGAISKKEQLTLNINTGGGSVFEALAIYNAIKTSKVTVNTVNMGLVASAGVLLFLAGKKRKMHANSMLMMHKARIMGGDAMTADQMREEADNMDKANDVMMNIISEGSGMPLEKVKGLLAEDKDVYLSANECLQMGIATEIVTGGALKSLTLDANTDPMRMVAQIEEFYNNENKTETMENQKNEALTALEKENQELKAQLDVLKSELQASKAEKEAFEVQAKEDLITASIADGKILATSKDNLMAMKLSDVKMLVDAVAPKPTASIGQAIMAQAKPTGRETWTIRDWESKDPAGLLAMKKENPEVYTTMFNEFYKK